MLLKVEIKLLWFQTRTLLVEYEINLFPVLRCYSVYLFWHNSVSIIYYCILLIEESTIYFVCCDDVRDVTWVYRVMSVISWVFSSFVLAQVPHHLVCISFMYMGVFFVYRGGVCVCVCVFGCCCFLVCLLLLLLLFFFAGIWKYGKPFESQCNSFCHEAWEEIQFWCLKWWWGWLFTIYSNNIDSIFD